MISTTDLWFASADAANHGLEKAMRPDEVDALDQYGAHLLDDAVHVGDAVRCTAYLSVPGSDQPEVRQVDLFAQTFRDLEDAQKMVDPGTGVMRLPK